MCDFGSVKFDTMVVNTELAEEYFKQNNYVFQSKTDLKVHNITLEHDGHNSIHTTTFDENMIIPYYSVGEPDINGLHDKLLKLADLVEEKAETFCQIENIIRNIPVNEVRDYDIKLITQNLTWNRTMRLMGTESSNYYGIMMNSESPLANIGFVAQLLMTRNKVIIISTKETAAVTSLFVELCHKSGLRSVEVILIEKDQVSNNFYDLATVPALKKGCIGVITERSDLDSAVDMFLRASTSHPWKLTQIYVQESIYDRFKKAMAWKTSSTTEVGNKIEARKRLCDKVYESNGKTFFVDYAGSPTPSDTSNEVLVEAYRTTKELISLVTKYEALCLSLWSSDLSEANEIAYKVPCTIVWINDYGIFDGPPNCSQAIYKELYRDVEIRILSKTQKSLLTQQQVEWSKKSFNQRRKIIHNAAAEMLKKGFLKDIQNLIDALQEIDSDDFSSVNNGRICSGVSLPTQFVHGNVTTVKTLVKLLTSGAAVILLPSALEKFADLGFGIPITVKTDGENEAIKITPYASRTKIVRTNFGTIFAN